MTPTGPLILCEFLIPLVRDGDRRVHRPSTWSALHDALFRCFSGYRGPEAVYRLRRPIPGEYESASGARIRDECRQYRVALPESRLGARRAVLRRAANTFDQESIFLSVRGEVELVTANDSDGFLTQIEEG